MLPLSHLSAGQLASVRFVLTDIDDTLTDGGKLTADAYTAMWNLFHAGVKVIAVTGRPAGWCDAIARQWPVAAVVGENGAFVFSETNGRLDMLHNPRAADADSAQERLAVLWKAVQQEVPRARIAKDQFSRIYDIAIDFAEEHPHLTREEVRKIHAVCEREGATAKVSSIHVNAWYGDYSKLGMSERFLREQYGVDMYEAHEGVAYIGDSPNDCPMFEAIPLSVGVANVHDCIDLLDPEPKYVTSNRGGAGFAEFAAAILEAREKSL